ncbi:DUF427 domain-containing protein [Limibacter armeniacum]|uniref:DUF427 domain-containing protein n=1 Tax=Limibacter armeniacum TaxID=466084 RepID=UPI002FE622F8
MKIIKPKAGQESVWDYPRPPIAERVSKHIKIFFDGMEIANTNRSWRVLETSHPPVYYIPVEDFKTGILIPSDKTSNCEFKGIAHYYHIQGESIEIRNAAWYYPNPNKGFETIKNHVAVYPSMMDKCTVNDEVVRAQEGDFYGGWITKDIVGPFKGGTGTWGW